MPTSRDRLSRILGRVRRSVLARRRLLAALLAGVAVAAGLHATVAPPPATVAVTVAAHDLAAGDVLEADDLTTGAFAPGTEPAGLQAAPAGRMLAAPLRRGEPVTDLRLVGPSLTEGRPELIAVPVRFPDAGMVTLLRVGDRIDLVSADPQNGDAQVVASAVLVLALPGDTTEVASTGVSGRLVVVGVHPGEVSRIADAAVRTFLTFAYAA